MRKFMGLLAVSSVSLACLSPAWPQTPTKAPPAPKMFVMHEYMVFFDQGSSALRPETQTVAMQVVKRALACVKDPKATVTGYSDASKAERAVPKLSEKRAMAIANFLAENHVDASSLAVLGKGEEDPLLSVVGPDEAEPLNQRAVIRYSCN